MSNRDYCCVCTFQLPTFFYNPFFIFSCFFFFLSFSFHFQFFIFLLFFSTLHFFPFSFFVASNTQHAKGETKSRSPRLGFLLGVVYLRGLDVDTFSFLFSLLFSVSNQFLRKIYIFDLFVLFFFFFQNRFLF